MRETELVDIDGELNVEDLIEQVKVRAARGDDPIVLTAAEYATVETHYFGQGALSAPYLLVTVGDLRIPVFSETSGGHLKIYREACEGWSSESGMRTMPLPGEKNEAAERILRRYGRSGERNILDAQTPKRLTETQLLESKTSER